MYFGKKSFFILCLNELISFVDFKSDDRLSILLATGQVLLAFWPVLLLRNGRFNVEFKLRPIALEPFL